MADAIDDERERLTEIIREAGARILKSQFFDGDLRAEIEYGPGGQHYFRVTIQELAVVGIDRRR